MVRLHALGQCEFEIGRHHVTPQADVLFALLLLLSSSPGELVHRSDLLALLWPDSDGNAARHRLRQALYQLKKLGVPLTTAESAIVLRKSDVEVDFATFRSDRKQLTARVSESPQLEFLPRYLPTFSQPFARWVESERDRVAATLRRLLLEAIAEHRAESNHAGVIACARACLGLDATVEEATIALAESLALIGSQNEALSAIDQNLEDRRTLGEAPSRLVVALRRRIAHSIRRHPRPAFGSGDLVGRATIVRDIEAWLKTDPADRPVLTLLGDAGIGKTRLLGEATRIAALHGRQIIEYRASVHGENRPLAGLLDLLPLLLALPGAVGCNPESFRRLTDLARGIRSDTSVPSDTPESAFRFAVLRRSVADLLEAVLCESDIILALDDVHGLDKETLEILLDVRRPRAKSFGLVMSLRPAGTNLQLLEKLTDNRVIRVPQLSADEARFLLTRDLPQEAAIQRAKTIDWALDLAAGNPFFLVELSAHCKLERSLSSLPESLQNALEQRLAALSAPAHLILQACAVLAKNSSLSRLELMLAFPPHTTAAALGELELAGLIASSDNWVGCRHEIIADVTLRTLGVPLGTYLHRRCAIVLDRELASSPVASLAWDCARHWEAADEPTKALDLTKLIVDQLLSLGLPGAAAELCARAEVTCRTAEEKADLLLRVSRAQRLLYDWDGVVTSLEQRRALLSRTRLRADRYSEDESALAEARWWRQTNGRIIGRAVQHALCKRAPSLHRLQMSVLALIVADNQHRPNEAMQVATAVADLEAKTPQEDAEKCKIELIYHTAFGCLDTAVAKAAQLVDIERRTGTSAGLLRALRWSSKPLLYTNDISGAMAALEEAYSEASRLGLRAEMWNATNYVQTIALDCERVDIASAWLPIIAELTEDASVRALRLADYSYFAARLAFTQGEYDESRALLERSRGIQRTLPRVQGDQSVTALDVLLRLSTSQSTVPVAMLSRLRRLHVKSRGWGVRDFESAALFAGLISRGEQEDATSLLRYYLRVRRTRTDHHSTLRSVETRLFSTAAASPFDFEGAVA